MYSESKRDFLSWLLMIIWQWCCLEASGSSKCSDWSVIKQEITLLSEYIWCKLGQRRYDSRDSALAISLWLNTNYPPTYNIITAFNQRTFFQLNDTSNNVVCGQIIGVQSEANCWSWVTAVVPPLKLGCATYAILSLFYYGLQSVVKWCFVWNWCLASVSQLTFLSGVPLIKRAR